MYGHFVYFIRTLKTCLKMIGNGPAKYISNVSAEVFSPHMMLSDVSRCIQNYSTDVISCFKLSKVFQAVDSLLLKLLAMMMVIVMIKIFFSHGK